MPFPKIKAVRAFVLRGGYSRQGNVFSLIGAVAAMILILVGHMSVVSAAGNDLRLWPAIYLNALVPTVVGLFFVLRPRKHRRRSAETGALAAAE